MYKIKDLQISHSKDKFSNKIVIASHMITMQSIKTKRVIVVPKHSISI